VPEEVAALIRDDKSEGENLGEYLRRQVRGNGSGNQEPTHTTAEVREEVEELRDEVERLPMDVVDELEARQRH